MRTRLIAAFGACALAGCASGAAAPPATPGTISFTDAQNNDPAWAARWAAFYGDRPGVVPPKGLFTTRNPATRSFGVLNRTNGAVSDADAQAWGLSLARSIDWEWWADTYGQVNLLGHIGRGADEALGRDYAWFRATAEDGGKLTLAQPVISQVTLIPDGGLQDDDPKEPGQIKGFAFVTVVSRWWQVTQTRADGSRTPLASPADERSGVKVLVDGFADSVPELGTIWLMRTFINCETGAYQALCASA